LSREAEMAEAGLFVGFGLPVRGRERQAVKVFTEALEYYARLQQQGEIESFETVLLESHGGDLNGFTLVRGDPDKLASIRTSDEFARLSLRADLITERFGVVGAVLGERIATLMGVFNEQVEDLT
jgi:hypothetical protein